MRWQQLAMRTISEAVSIVRKPFGEPKGLRILIYHAVGDTPVYGDTIGLNTINLELFKKHIDIISKLSTTPLLPLSIDENKLKVAITFDDGYADNLHIAAPLLAEAGIPFTVFVTSDFVKNRSKGFLSPSELKRLALIPGATIGSHTCSHPHLTKCNDSKLRVELEDSKSYLENLLGKEVLSFAYPYGDVDMRVRNAVYKAGYKVGACSRFDINRPERDKLLLNRCFILCNDTQRVLQQKLRGDWDWFRRRSIDLF